MALHWKVGNVASTVDERQGQSRIRQTGRGDGRMPRCMPARFEGFWRPIVCSFGVAARTRRTGHRIRTAGHLSPRAGTYTFATGERPQDCYVGIAWTASAVLVILAFAADMARTGEADHALTHVTVSDTA